MLGVSKQLLLADNGSKQLILRLAYAAEVRLTADLEACLCSGGAFRRFETADVDIDTR